MAMNTDPMTAIPFSTALQVGLTAPGQPMRRSDCTPQMLLERFHPDYGAQATCRLTVGPSKGARCHPVLARIIQGNALIGDVDLAAIAPVTTDILVIGGGGAGVAAALAAREAGAGVILAAKLRVGDSNTVMAEGGIQAAVGDDDSLQRHYDDTLKGGHNAADPALVERLVGKAPAIIRWLIQLGMHFDLADGPTPGARLLRKRAGGTTAARILSYRDFTGLEMMRVLREAVELDRGVTILNRHPAVELLSNDHGHCAGAVLYDLEHATLRIIRARAVILATGGAGRLHLQGFATSNHYGATADGLALAYRIGARVRDMDSFQFHPTGIAWPQHLAGGLISEAVRSLGAKLINGLGERFIDELAPRDVVTAAILRECAEGRGVERDGQVGVLLDTPGLLAEKPGLLSRQLVSLAHLADRCGIDPRREPLLIRPTLHYQNGGVEIDRHGATAVPGLYCAGEVAGGIHGRNRLMGNALLDILVFGREAGKAAATLAGTPLTGRVGLEHVRDWQRQLTYACMIDGPRSPLLYPAYGNFDLRAHMATARKG
ncbi:FAD-binding protein [Niveispirillum sp. BGYR6]|uniref:FAD-binding protein n=1 Tax=Niveispirillum sp. BGYR6 TaxID=2971249 RepID=UPI0022B960A5|nr:FAD-binding protein [Niveispirillum sp. BGYR6]MDG5496214.1 FAD-binding protein [Niveispirillum sp. BGYR6]